MSPEFKIAETPGFQKKLKSKAFKHLEKKIRAYVYPVLKKNPFFGSNIKKLKGELSDVYRYRIGDYRLFYTIHQEELVVVAIDLYNRKDAYKA